MIYPPSQDHDAGEGYDCACDPGYTGRDCGTEINECDPDPCVNGACVVGYIQSIFLMLSAINGCTYRIS